MATENVTLTSKDNTCCIKSIDWFGTWHWNHKYDTCSICKESLDSACLLGDCDIDMIDKACDIVVGECSHVYHKICLHRWLKVNPTCPLCNVSWKERKE